MASSLQNRLGFRSDANRPNWTDAPQDDDREAIAQALLALTGKGEGGGALRVILDRMDRRDADTRADRERERTSGELAGLSDVQRAYVLSARTPEERTSRLGTVAMVNRHKQLKGAGLDPQGKFVRAQRRDETPEQYTTAMRGASDAAETRRKQVADKLRAQTELDKQRAASNAAAGRPGYARGVIAEPTDTRSLGERTATGTAVMRGQRPPMSDAEMGDAQALIASGGQGPLPPSGVRYRGGLQYAGQPTRMTGDYDTPADALASADSLAQDDEQEAIRQALLRINPEEYARLGGAPLFPR